MAEACTATGGCKLGPLREVLGRKREGAATPKFRLQPDAQSAVRRGASIGIAVCQSLCPCAGQLSRACDASNGGCRGRRDAHIPRFDAVTDAA
jgi:hypothetical protein